MYLQCTIHKFSHHTREFCVKQFYVQIFKLNKHTGTTWETGQKCKHVPQLPVSTAPLTAKLTSETLYIFNFFYEKLLPEENSYYDVVTSMWKFACKYDNLLLVFYLF